MLPPLPWRLVAVGTGVIAVVIVAVLAPEIAVLVAMLVTKVTMKLAVLPTRQPIGMGLVMFITDGIVIVVVFITQLLMLASMLPIPLIPPILVLGHCRNCETKG